jgi:hypothetical protein
MKRNKIIAVAVVVMMMVGAVVLMSCASCPGSGDCSFDETTGIPKYCVGSTSDTDEAEKMVQCLLDITAGKECSC